MKLGEKQELFMRLLPRLIDKAHELLSDLAVQTNQPTACCDALLDLAQFRQLLLSDHADMHHTASHKKGRLIRPEWLVLFP